MQARKRRMAEKAAIGEIEDTEVSIFFCFLPYCVTYNSIYYFVSDG